MNGNRDFLAFPLLSLWEKARLAWVTIHARRFANPRELYSISAHDWLTRHCGAHAYEVFWKPLLQAKFGIYHDQVAATFIWATITRLFGARSGAAKAEHLGYVSGGYARILKSFRAELERLGVRVRSGTAVRGIAPSNQSMSSFSLAVKRRSRSLVSPSCSAISIIIAFLPSDLPTQ